MNKFVQDDHQVNRIRKRIGGLSDYYINACQPSFWLCIEGRTEVITNFNGAWATYNLYGLDQIGQIRRSGTTWNRYLSQRLISLRLNFLKDHLGSVRVIVDTSGNVVAYDDYYPFGLQMPGRTQDSAAVDGRYKFTGKERDAETKYDYFGARYYDARIGRWLQVDPMAEKYIGISPYQYSFNNPIRYYDPDGNFVVESKRGGVIAHRYTKSEYRTAQVFEFLPVLSTASLINRTLRGDPSFSPGLGTWLIHGASVGTGLGLGYLTTFMKQAKPIEKAIVKFIAQRSEAVVSLPTIELEKGSREMIAEDKAIFEKAITKEIEEGVPLAVPAQFVTTHYYGRGEREGYYAPDTEWVDGIPQKIMINPELEEKWREKEDLSREQIERRFRWYLERLLSILLVFIVATLTACSSSRTSDDSVLYAENKAVYVESQSKERGVFAGPTNIVLIDINNGNKYYISEDPYFNFNTAISRCGEYVVFLSNRIGTKTELEIKGARGPHEVYLWNKNEKVIRRFGESIEKEYGEIMSGRYEDIHFGPESKSIYFLNFDNILFKTSKNEKRIDIVKNIDKNIGRSERFSISGNGKYIIVAMSGEGILDIDKNKLLLIDVDDKSSEIIYESGNLLFTGGWSDDNYKFLFIKRGNIYEYEIYNSKVRKLYDSEVVGLTISSPPYYHGTNHLIFLAQKRNHNNEIVRYNIEDNTYELITDDSYPKYFFDITINN